MIGPLKQTFGVKLKPELDYMTTSEQSHFKEMMSTGTVSMYRTSQCLKCQKEIPKHKVYCSLKCKEIHEKEQEDTDGQNE